MNHIIIVKTILLILIITCVDNKYVFIFLSSRKCIEYNKMFEQLCIRRENFNFNSIILSVNRKN